MNVEFSVLCDLSVAVWAVMRSDFGFIYWKHVEDKWSRDKQIFDSEWRHHSQRTM